MQYAPLRETHSGYVNVVQFAEGKFAEDGVAVMAMLVDSIFAISEVILDRVC